MTHSWRGWVMAQSGNGTDKAAGFGLIAPEVLAMMPYLATILVLTIISMRPGYAYSAAPACLGKPFLPSA